MKAIADFLYEARMLKELPRSGYHFLGSGRESVAEHGFLASVAGYALAQLHPEADGAKVVQMCLIHDLGEARVGDLNYVQKKYVKADERRAIADLARHLPFGSVMTSLFDEFRACQTLESKLAHDADQLALVVELKVLCDLGYQGPEHWIPHVLGRLSTDKARAVADAVLNTPSDAWWFEEKGNDL